MDSNAFGKYAEEQAVKYLKNEGLKILEINFHSLFGEVDIIAQSNDLLHFIEVKATKKEYDPLERITPKKMEKLTKTIDFYLLKNITDLPYQIDALIIKDDKVEWIKNIYY